MTRSQALEFLELQADATIYEIKQRISEKLQYYQELSENAPSDFLRRLNARHAVKVEDIKRLFPEWNPEKLESSVELPMDDADALLLQAEIAAGELTMPVILSSAERKQLITQSALPDPPGWLIRNTENKSYQSYSLTVGKNYIGRKADPTLNPFIVIEEDSSVSKVQAVIWVELINGQHLFYIADTPGDNGGRASSNGTFVNGNPQRISNKMELQEKDTIQMGMTKLVLKVNKSTLKEAVQAVKKSKFIHTVVLNNKKQADF